MSILPIVECGEPVLHARAAAVDAITPDILALVADMRETLAASNGVGLAAPQVGVGLRIFLYDTEDDEGVRHVGTVLNPQLVTSKVPGTRPDKEDDAEGCLSVPGVLFPLVRAPWARLTGVDERGEPVRVEATGWFARVLQHEYDHLDGKLYVDRLDDRWGKRWTKTRKAEGWGVPGHSWLPGTDPDPFGH